MLENKNFSLHRFFLYEYALKNNIDFLKFAQHIEYMLITFAYSDNNSDEISKRVSKNTTTRLKLSSLLYLLFEENFKIKVLMESSSNLYNSQSQSQTQFLSIQRLLITNRNTISNLLESLFTHASLLNFVKRHEIINNKAENNTIVVLKYPLDALEEAITFDKRFEFSPKNLYLSITLKFKYTLSSNDFLDLH